jgi:predicted acetyltransferase
MSGSMEEEYVLHLEDLSDFVEEILIEGDYPDEQFENLYTFWRKKFKESAALIVSDQLIADYMNDFESDNLNKALRDLIKEGQVDVMWDSEKNDFVFKAV